MTPAQVDLARRLVAAPWWEWRAGMLCTGDGWFECATILEVDGNGVPIEWAYRGHIRGPGSPSGDLWDGTGVYPILTDDGTAGVLLGMLSRLTTTSTRTRPDPYAVSVVYWLDNRPHATPLAPTLGEAAARALLEVRGG